MVDAPPHRSKEYWADLAQAIGGHLVKYGNAQERKEWGKTIKAIKEWRRENAIHD